MTSSAISHIPGRLLIEINKLVGFRLLTKAGQRGVINFVTIVPVVGGVVGSAVDGAACFTAGKGAKEFFHSKEFAGPVGPRQWIGKFST